MNSEELEKIFQKQEGPTLDFKSEWYKIDSVEKITAEYQKGEMIKDILSLANGNANVAGETAYLIIGAGDDIDQDNEREIHDIQDVEKISRDRILKIVNRICEPNLEDIWCDPILIDGKTLVVITIPPSPYLYEITEKLKTPKRNYDEFTVFIRQGERNSTASTKERVAISQLKQLRFSEQNNVPPMWFGGFVGATIGGLLVPPMAKEINNTKEIRIAGGIAGIIAGGFIGGMFGLTFKNIREIRRHWSRTPLKDKVLAITASGSISILSIVIQSRWKKDKGS